MTEQLELGFETPEPIPRGRRARQPAPRDGASGHRPGPVRGAIEIARALERPDPTAEQVAVIEAPIEPLLVIAGAGSGKTETMASRVVWLVANGHVEAEEVLGLTFTRKAAGELAERVRSRLRALHRHGLVAAEPQPVPVSTYHSYAASVLGDHGLRLGVEPGSRLLGEAGAWQLAAELVERWDGDMLGVDRAPSGVVEAVLELAGECAEHLVDPADVDAEIGAVLDRAATLPAALGEVGPGVPQRAVRDRLHELAARRRLVPLVQAYVRRKRELEVLDFGDQVALAARLARDVPEIGEGERARFRVVLLDEYQDTSHAQLVLLRSLFGGGHPVVAVGDPHQSIYGWRGASAGNLQRFPTEFRRAGDSRPAGTRYLSTSWRNDAAVLQVANRLSADLRVPVRWADPDAVVEVPALVARPGAGTGGVRAAWLATVEEEATQVADTIAAQWHGSDPAPTAAVLCRARAQFPLVEAALRARGLPVEVVGLGGLLTQPEVADLRATLEVLHDPSRGDSLMRLLTGPAWRIGPRDLEALGAWATGLIRSRAHSTDRAADRGATPDPPVELDTVDERSIVDALDTLPGPGWVGPAGQQLSPVARERLGRLGAMLRELRGRAGLPLPDLVLEVERSMLLDIEVAALSRQRPASARANLDAFADVAAGFAGGGDRPGLGSFLAWLAAADQRERGLESPLGQVRNDAVQVLTVHAAKGLEWDVVAVTGLVEGTFPAGRNGRPPAASNGWLGEPGALPYRLRGDARGLPHWAVEAATTQKELTEQLEIFRDQCGAHEVAEERRLAYVAVTRARGSLLLTGAVWGSGSTPRHPSRFMVEASELSGVETVSWQQDPADGATNPREIGDPVPWPRDVLGERRGAIERAATLVRAAAAALSAAPPVPVDGSLDRPGPPGPWAREVDLLLAERDDAGRRRLQVPLPTHLSASRVVALADDPAALALRLRRPMPEPPSPHARRGSAFHAWLERRFGAAALVDVDELPGSADDVVGDDELAALQRRFLASEWAGRTPEAVEVSVETPVGDLVVRGRIDAVFPVIDADGMPGWDVVDWKTGPAPSGPERARAAAVQLAVYRLAWARLNGVGVDQVGAAFFHASSGTTVRPVDLLDADGLVALITESLET
ncbi:MAG TPA: ATP-dependent DNA helicase [Kineosporiaceae bacterium]|nr:ATP-dependent DNA helicase [Kineosporiaceae bacterium]